MTGGDAAPRPQAWPTDWLGGVSVADPTDWVRPGLVLVFHVGCAGCVSRAVPFLLEAARAYADRLELVAVHSALGRSPTARERVAWTLDRFAHAAGLEVPVALDLDGAWAEAEGAEGTPHWFAYAPGGGRVRSVFGSQENALTRLRYLLDELAGS